MDAWSNNSIFFKRYNKKKSSAHQGLIDHKHNKTSEILLEFKIAVFYVNVLNCNLFLYFQHHYSSLQCHMIFRNHTNILIYDQEAFLIIINVENSRAAQYFCGNRDSFIE